MSDIESRSLGICVGRTLATGLGLVGSGSEGLGMKFSLSKSILSIGSTSFSAQSFRNALIADVNFVLRFSISLSICF